MCLGSVGLVSGNPAGVVMNTCGGEVSASSRVYMLLPMHHGQSYTLYHFR